MRCLYSVKQESSRRKTYALTEFRIRGTFTPPIMTMCFGFTDGKRDRNSPEEWEGLHFSYDSRNDIGSSLGHGQCCGNTLLLRKSIRTKGEE